MTFELHGLHVAILVTNGYEQIECLLPRGALESAGVEVSVVSPVRHQVIGWDLNDWGEALDVDIPLSDTDPNDYHALVMPGGLMNADALRIDPVALSFIRAFFEDGKPVATIRHGAWPLIDAGVVRGRRLTSWPSLRRDLENAGARWIDEPVVEDAGLLSSRWPSDLDEFNRAMLRAFARASSACGPISKLHASNPPRPMLVDRRLP